MFAVLDVMMEGMNGIETSIALLDIFPNCSIVLVSGRQETAQLLQKELDKGNDIEVLAKPVHPQILLDTIAALSQAISSPVAR